MIRIIMSLVIGFGLGVMVAKTEDWYSHRKMARKAKADPSWAAFYKWAKELGSY